MLEPTADTFPKLVISNAQRLAGKVAIREKDLGIWQSYTWSEYLEQARLIALGLAALGFSRGDKTAVVLANHGAIVTGETIEEACYQAVTFERMCKFFYDSMLTGRPPREIKPEIRAAMKPGLKKGCPPVFWDGAVRQLLRRQPDVLD